MPSTSGMRTSISDDVGPLRARRADGVAAVAGLADDLERRVAGEDRRAGRRASGRRRRRSARGPATPVMPAAAVGQVRADAEARRRARPSPGCRRAAPRARACRSSPWPPRRRAPSRARPGSSTASSSASGPNVDRDRRAAATVAGGVGERLLQDAVGGRVDARRSGRRSPSTSPSRQARLARWRSASVSSAARPGGGSTPGPAPSSRSARTSWSISPTVSRATSSIVCERRAGPVRVALLQQARRDRRAPGSR